MNDYSMVDGTMCAGDAESWCVRPVPSDLADSSTSSRYFTEVACRQRNRIISGLVNRITSIHVVDSEITRPSEDVVIIASKLVMRFYDSAAEVGAGWRDALVTGNFDGEVVFEWWGKDRKLTVRVGEIGIEACRVWRDGIDVVDDEVSIAEPMELRGVWRWITADEH